MSRFSLLLLSPLLLAANLPSSAALRLTPSDVTLTGARAQQRLLVTASFGDGTEADLTHDAAYESLAPTIVAVAPGGVLTPRGDGSATVAVRFGGRESRINVTVRGFAEAVPVDFRTDGSAALSRAGCNSGACHGSPQGKNQFRLSLRGYDPNLDLQTLVREVGGRRVDRHNPDGSLLLQKGSGRVAHGGGVIFNPSDAAYSTLRQWIAEGCVDSPKPQKLARLEVLPASRLLHGDFPRQQLAAIAHFEDGSRRDVSDLAVFSINQHTTTPATVTPTGFVTIEQTAEVSVLVRYLDRVTSARLTYVRPDPAFAFVAPAPANVVDELVFAKQKQLQLSPAPLCSDEVFVRRVYLDAIGALPTADEARQFLDDKNPAKRAQLIDRLLEREEYASFWALKWADVLRGSPTTISERGIHSFHRWLVRAVATDMPFDKLARDLITAQGNPLHKPAANFYRISRTPDEAAETVAQLFLGVRVQCAKCHNHPFEALTQTDYYGLAAYFARVQRKGFGFGLEDEIIYTTNNGDVQHPLTRKTQEPIAFGTPAGSLAPDEDRRQKFADWLTQADNPYFARSLVNRVWYHLNGKGIVDPVDDFRDTNPPSNPELLQALADAFAKGGYRMKPLVKLILNSRTYQLASSGGAVPSKYAAAPADRYFTKAAVKMLTAEQILDAVSTATGLPEKFAGYPLGTRAVDLAEGGVGHPFLQAFSKPVRDVSCECGRDDDPTLPQMLHLLNNHEIADKILSPRGRLGRLLRENRDTNGIVEQLYLATLSRRPTKAELDVIGKHVAAAGKDRAKALADVQHALINAGEFLLRH